MDSGRTLAATARSDRAPACLMAVLVLALAVIPFACRRGEKPAAADSQSGDGYSGARSPIDPRSVNVCKRIPGEAVAKALGGERADVLAFGASEDQPSRCRYSVIPAGGGQGRRQVFIVWLMAPNDFEVRRLQLQNPVTPVRGVGDGAFVTYAPRGDQTELYVFRRDVATIQIAGPDRAALIKVAKVVLEYL